MQLFGQTGQIVRRALAVPDALPGARGGLRQAGQARRNDAGPAGGSASAPFPLEITPSP